MIAALALALATALAGDEVMLGLEINGVPAHDLHVVLVEGDVLCRRDDLLAAGLHGFDQGAMKGELLSLRSLAPGLTYEVDQGALVLKLHAAAEHLPASHIDAAQSVRPADLAFRPTPAAFLNYAVQTAAGAEPSAFVELGASAGNALLYSGVSRAPGSAPVRGLSNLTLDDRSALRRLIVGDFAATSGSPIGSGGLLLGLGFGRELSLDPYFISSPREQIQGSVTTPAKMDVYEGGRLVRTVDVAPGVFQVDNLPGAGAPGDTRLVVRDAFGRAQEYTATTRAPANLLAPGFRDDALQIGFRRRAFGVESFDYGAPAFYARERVGVTHALTASLRGEGALDLISAGPGVAFAMPFAAFELVSAASRNQGYTGGALSLLAASHVSAFSLSLQLAAQSARYATLSLAPLDDRAALLARATLSTSVLHRLVITSSLSAQAMRDGARTSQLMLQASLPLWRAASLTASATFARSGSVDSFTAWTGLSIPLGGLQSAMISADSSGSAVLQAQRGLPAGDGVGYTLRATEGHGAAGSADVQAQNGFGRLEAMGTLAPGARDWTAGASGGLVATRGELFATRPVQDGVAVVEVPGVAGVHTFLNGQDVGTTNRNGRLLLPSVLPFQSNRISIRDTDVPLGYDIRGAEQNVAGPLRGAALAAFEVHRPHAFAGRLRIVAPDGSLTPENADLVFDGKAWPVGLNGEFLLEDVPDGTREALVRLGGGACSFRLSLRAGKEPLSDVGEQVCTTSVPLRPEEAAVSRAIHGTVTLAGRPLRGVRVRAAGLETRTDPDGAYWLQGVPSGEVLVEVHGLPGGVVVPPLKTLVPQGSVAVEANPVAHRAAPTRWTEERFSGESPAGAIDGYVMHWSDAQNTTAALRLGELARLDPRDRLVVVLPRSEVGFRRRRAHLLERRLTARFGEKVVPVWSDTRRPVVLLLRGDP